MGEEDPASSTMQDGTAAKSSLPSAPDNRYFEYFFFHPYARLFIACFISSLNFLIYAEDPVAHSFAEATLPIIGHDYGLIFLRYPPNGMSVLKVVVWVIFLIAGLVVGRLVVHHLVLRDMLQLEMFGWRLTDSDDLRKRQPYCPCKRNTPYNKLWWWGADNTIEYEEEMAARMKRLPEGWRTREEYQTKEETVVEAIMPCLCHPKKHKEHSKGTWMAMFFSVILVMMIGVVIYNGFVHAHYDDKEDRDSWEIGPGLQTRNRVFMKVAAVGTWLGDFFTAVMVFDGMLQEIGRHHTTLTSLVHDGVVSAEDMAAALSGKLRYFRPSRAVKELEGVPATLAKSLNTPARRLKMGFVEWWPALASRWGKPIGESPLFTYRVVVVWILFIAATTVVLVGILADFIKWDEWSEGISATNEVTRTLLAASITAMDLIIVMQDWEFPAFDTSQEVKFPGVEVSEINCGDCCGCEFGQTGRGGSSLGRRKLPCFSAFATGKWFNYGIIFLVMCLDFNMLKNQIIYEPGAFGQYINPDTQEICTIRDYEISNALVTHYTDTKTEIYTNGTFYWSRVRGGFLIPGSYDGLDFCMPSKYIAASSTAKFIAAIPSFSGVALFFYFYYRYNRLDIHIAQCEQGIEEGSCCDGL